MIKITIELIDFQIHPIHAEWWIDILGITIGSHTRSLFYINRDGNKFQFNIFFFKIDWL